MNDTEIAVTAIICATVTGLAIKRACSGRGADTDTSGGLGFLRRCRFFLFYRRPVLGAMVVALVGFLVINGLILLFFHALLWALWENYTVTMIGALICLPIGAGLMRGIGGDRGILAGLPFFIFPVLSFLATSAWLIAESGGSREEPTTQPAAVEQSPKVPALVRVSVTEREKVIRMNEVPFKEGNLQTTGPVWVWLNGDKRTRFLYTTSSSIPRANDVRTIHLQVDEGQRPVTVVLRPRE